MTSAMSSGLFPKMKIFLFLREADEQMKHLELLFTIFWTWIHRKSLGCLGCLGTSREGGDEFTRVTDVIDKLVIRDWFQS